MVEDENLITGLPDINPEDDCFVPSVSSNMAAAIVHKTLAEMAEQSGEGTMTSAVFDFATGEVSITTVHSEGYVVVTGDIPDAEE